MDRNKRSVYYMAKMLQLVLTPIAKIKFYGKRPWIISERGFDARDNGYQFFLYLRNKHPEINAWYLITRDSKDLKKVVDLGNILYKGTIKHFMLYISASLLLGAFEPIIPSANKRFGELIKKKNDQKYIFLQHGIIGNDLPVYHKENAKFDLFFCGAKPEFDYVSKYFNYTEGEVRYTGLARFDALHNIKPQKMILIMPTWRRWIAEMDADEITQSEYVLRWNSIINNPLLIDISEKYDVNIIFYPHALMQKSIGFFSSSNDRIIIANQQEYDLQTLIKDSSMLITDYSSVNFDFAYMNKPVLYYQFDDERFFKDHVGVGWFDYKNMGFGECVNNEEDLFICVKDYLVNGFRMKPNYEQRIKSVFPLYDDNNCERIYQEIINSFDADELF